LQPGVGPAGSFSSGLGFPVTEASTMKHPILGLILLLAAAPVCLAAPSVSGDYLEARTSEVNTAGAEAVFAWRVRQGAWKGVAIDGLSVVAVVRAAATLGDPTRSPLPARSVLLV